MPKLTASQVAAQLNVTAYTIKRWYQFYENLTPDELADLMNQGMPELPKCEKIGTMGWRYWNMEDLPGLEKFKNWIPNTRNGIFQKYKK